MGSSYFSAAFKRMGVSVKTLFWGNWENSTKTYAIYIDVGLGSNSCSAI